MLLQSLVMVSLTFAIPPATVPLLGWIAHPAKTVLNYTQSLCETALGTPTGATKCFSTRMCASGCKESLTGFTHFHEHTPEVRAKPSAS
jgi:hypothetical protein